MRKAVPSFAAILLLLALPTFAAPPKHRPKPAAAVAERREVYLVLFRDLLAPETTDALAAELSRKHDTKLRATYRYAASGFAAEMTASAAAAIAKDGRVESVEKDRMVQLAGDRSTANSSVTTRQPAEDSAGWMLSRISQRQNPSVANAYPKDHYSFGSTGQGVVVYLLDTEVDTSTPEFENRVHHLFERMGNPVPDPVPASDCEHGTVVSTLIAGSIHGVAPGATMRTLPAIPNCRTSTETWVIARGIDLVLDDHLTNNQGQPAVLNLSFEDNTGSVVEDTNGGAAGRLIRRSLTTLARKGIVAVQAAGNFAHDICSPPPPNPATDPQPRDTLRLQGTMAYSSAIRSGGPVILVGGTGTDDRLYRWTIGGPVAARFPEFKGCVWVPGSRNATTGLWVDGHYNCPTDCASSVCTNEPGSNYGPCIDLLAPATNIRAAVPGGQLDTPVTPSGTSYAVPLVVGAIARLLSEDPGLYDSTHPERTTERVLHRLWESATIVDSGNPSTTNRLLYIGAVPITRQPRSTVVRSGSAPLEVQAIGGNLKYQWFSSSGSDGYAVTPALGTGRTYTPDDPGRYWVRVKDDDTGLTADSAIAQYAVCADAPTIEMPMRMTIAPTDAVHINPVITGAPQDAKYQWYIGSSGDTHQAISLLQNTPQLSYERPQPTGYGYVPSGSSEYWLRVTWPACSVPMDSPSVNVDVCERPSRIVVNPGFSVEADGTDLTYEWLCTVGGVVTRKSVASRFIQRDSCDNLSVRVSNACGSVKVSVGACGAGLIKDRKLAEQRDGDGRMQYIVERSADLNATIEWRAGEAGTLGTVLGTSASFTPLSPGPYWVQVTGACPSGGSVEDIGFITPEDISPCTPPGRRRLVARSSELSAPGQPVTLSVEDDHDGATLDWYVGEVTPANHIGSGATITVTPNQTTKYTVTATKTCNGVAATVSTTVTVAVCGDVAIGTPPVSKTVTVPQNGTADIDAFVEPLGVGDFTYTWYEGESGDTSHAVGAGDSRFTVERAKITFHATAGTSARVWVRVSGCSGMVSSNAVTLSAVTCPLPHIFSFGGGGMVPYPGASVTLTVTMEEQGGAYSYRWFRGNGTPFGGNSASIQAPTSGFDSYYVEVSQACGNSTATVVSGRAYVYVYDNDCMLPPVSVSQNARDLLEAGSITFTAFCNGPVQTYQWYRGDTGDTRHPVSADPGQPSRLTFGAGSVPALYWVRATRNCGGWQDSPAVSFTRGECSAVRITAQPASTDVARGDSALLDVEAESNSALSYAWTPFDLNTGIVSYTQTATVSPSKSTRYLVEVTNSCLAHATSTPATVRVSGCSSIAVSRWPADAWTDLGTPVDLSVEATSTSALSYQWYAGELADESHPIAGANFAVLHTDALTAEARYWVRVTSAGGCLADSATVTVHVCEPPHLTNANVTGNVNVSANELTWLVYPVAGSDVLFQWYVGEQSDTSHPFGRDVDAVQVQGQTASYWVRATAHCGPDGADRRELDSPTFHVNVYPRIVQQPVAADAEILPNGTTTLSAVVTNDAVIQWYEGARYDRSHPVGGNSMSYVTAPLTHDTTYWLEASVGTAATASDEVTVHLCDTQVSWLSNPAVVHPNESYTLRVNVSMLLGDDAQLYWYRGPAGDVEHSLLVDGPSVNATSSVSSPATATYWARLRKTDSICYADTPPLTVTVIPRWTLTVTNAGGGTVTSAPAGINCGATCSASYDDTTAVTLTAAAAANFTFAGWSGACTGTATCQVTMSEGRGVTATFTAMPRLTVSLPSGGGAVSSAILNCVTTCSQTYPAGTAVTFTATAAPGYVFSGWGGDCSGTGTCPVTLTADRSVTATFVRFAAHDMNADGISDLFWRNTATNATAVWLMNGSTATTSPSLTLGDSHWQTMAMGDFNGDARADVLWRHDANGTAAVWFLSGASVSSTTTLTQVISDQNWKIEGTGDFNADRKMDLFWRYGTTGATAVWLANGTSSPAGIGTTTVADLNWRPAAYGDFDGNGTSDVAWRNSVTGETSFWFMNGGTVASTAASIAVSDPNWRIALAGSFDGDARDGLFWRNPVTGETMFRLMNGAAVRAEAAGPVKPAPWQPVVSGDFNGDQRSDIFWRNTATGETAIWFMNGTQVQSESPSVTVADLNWRPVGLAPMCPIPATIVPPPDQVSTVAQWVRLTAPAYDNSTYQWYRGAAGDTSAPVPNPYPAISYVDVNPSVTTQYWVEVQSGGCASRSAVTTVKVCIPQITSQPAGMTVAANTPATLTVAATTAGLTYQWYTGAAGNTSAPLAGFTGSSATVSPSATTSYWVRVTSSCARTVDSVAATVTVCQPPAISSVSNTAYITAGGSATIQVTATGSVLTYQWYAGASGNTASPIAGATGPSVSVSPAATATYWCRVTSAGACTANSSTVTVDVCSTPSITTQPASTITGTGQTATLWVNATAATGSLTYQWYRGVSGDTTTPVGTSAYVFTTPALTADTQYWVRVTRGGCPVNSATATVTVCAISPTLTGAPVAAGQSATLTASVANARSGNVYYYYYRGAPGDTSNFVTYGLNLTSVSVTPAAPGTQYSVVVNDGTCSQWSSVTIPVCVPTITAQPTSRAVPTGSQTTLTVGADSLATAYQWYLGASGNTASPVPGATGPSFTLTASATAAYWVRVTGSCGVPVNSAAATVTVCQPTAITWTTPSQSFLRGQTGQLRVDATGSNLQYQWYTGAVGVTTSPLANGTGATVTVTPQSPTTYWVRVTGDCGPVNSPAITLWVCATPYITTQPANVAVCSGHTATLTVSASEPIGGAMSYQWYRGQPGDTTSPVSGATGATFTTPALTAETTYFVRIASGNACAPVDSTAATVSINSCP
jgi:uncharacterized repeat protein (TIGR02543 family)